jgi:hypothetical protein
MASMDAKPKTKCRSFRFSLRTLLLLVTVCSVGFGWLSVKTRQAQRQKEAVEAIKKLGGSVMYNYQRDSSRVVIQSPTPPGPIWLRKWLGIDFFADVDALTIDDAVIERGILDADLAHLQCFTELQSLKLHVYVKGAGLVHLQGLTKLEYLELRHTNITDARLAHIQGLTKLTYLDLTRTKITDAGLVRLQGLTQLRDLRLGETKITDDGLLHLRGLTQLENLWLWRSHVTDAGCNELQNALPNLRISR